MDKRDVDRLRPVNDLFGGLYSAVSDRQVRLLLGLTLAVIVGAAVVYRLIEGWRWVDAFYFAAVTVATVGYGDFAPVTDAGKLFTIFYLVIGVGLFVAAAAALAEHVIDRARTRRAEARRRQDAGSDREDV